jgi:hypothetical protein
MRSMPAPGRGTPVACTTAAGRDQLAPLDPAREPGTRILLRRMSHMEQLDRYLLCWRDY